MILKSHILGAGIVTPHGAGAGQVFAAQRDGTAVPTSATTNPATGREYHVATVSPAVSAHLGREPRLRRASAISMLAATAAEAAIGASGIVAGPGTALVMGVSNGCPHYTRRFYEQIVKTGANTASPLLFPETVHNAPASHLAAMLKLDGATYTLIGDATVGMQALHFGAQLLAMGDAENVIVAAAEELDWILSEGHRVWRLTNGGGPCRPHSGGGALLAEGAAAVVLGKAGGFAQISTTEGRSVPSRSAATGALRDAIAQLGDTAVDWTVDGANGTWIDAAFSANQPTGDRFSPKEWTGEAIGASALQQIVLAAELLKHTGKSRALVPSLGWNQNACAAIVERSSG